MKFVVTELASLANWANIPDAPKKYPLKNVANFSRTIGLENDHHHRDICNAPIRPTVKKRTMYDIEFYTLITHLIVRKLGKFHIHYLLN